MSKLHSNYQIRWKNFRRFEDTDWVTIKPLTVLLGANNGGKSSVLSPLMLLSQTLRSDDAGVPLLPAGKLVDLGSFRDLVHLHDTDRSVFFGLRFHTHNAASKTPLKPVGSYVPGGVELKFSAGEKPGDIDLDHFRVTDIYNRPYFTRKRLKEGYSLDGAIKLKGMTSGERKIVKGHLPVNFMFTPNGVLNQVARTAKDAATKEQTPFSKDFSHYLRAMGFANSSIGPVLYNMSYVGPLRSKLQRFYRATPEEPDTVGAQGELAANLYRKREHELKDAVDEWVKKFEFGDALTVESMTDDIFKLSFRSENGRSTNIADAGFGASQVLPLIVQAAAAPSDSLTVAEQPEIHLNPRLQCLLADLFVDMATSGHRVLVETHSEHMVIRLRRLIAEGKISASDVSLYFVEKDGERSTIKEIPIEVNGSITRESWPKGFFEEGLRESLALATAQAKRAKKAKE